MRVPDNARHSWCLLTQDGTAGGRFRFVQDRLDRFLSGRLGSCPPNPFFLEAHGLEPPIAGPARPRHRRRPVRRWDPEIHRLRIQRRLCLLTIQLEARGSLQ
jgi:hypothetical protein